MTQDYHADSIGPGFPVVAIGASAGGVEALSAFFKRLPPHPQAAFIVITHLAAHQKSMLPEILGRCTAMPVATASDGQEMEAGHVYVIPPDGILTLAGGHLALSPRHEERNAIDLCLATLADEVGERAIAIILSGTGTDGSIGLKAVRTAGGFTLAQGSDGSSPSHHGMPDAAIATGFVDCTLPVEALADRVAAYIDAAAAPPRISDDTEAQTRLEDVRRQLCAALQDRVGHDFSGYKQNTFMRRAERRMHVRHVPDLQSYVRLISDEPEEVDALFRDLLIGVTTFFRDMASFEALGKVVAPRLIEGKGPNDTIRVWVPGCATGEEAYSVAIMLLQQLDQGRAQPRLQIFATDVDEKALAVARAGRYPQRLLDRMPRDRLERYFVQQGSNYVVAKELRDVCLFSCHSLVRDPPFSRIDLISCRNLLIYLTVDLQNQVIPLFHYALRPDGYLFLGASEHVSQHTTLFAPVDKKHRIFQRRPLPSRPPIFPSFRLAAAGYRSPPEVSRGLPGGKDAVRRSASVVLDKYAPAHLVVNGEWDVVHYSARTGKYLEAPAGAPNRGVLAMARNGLRLPLRSALHEAAETHRRTVREHIAVETEIGSQTIHLSVEPLPDAEAGPFWLVVFADIGGVAGHDDNTDGHPAERAAGRRPSDHEDAVDHMERELRQTRELLGSSIEEYQGMVEELKSSNEEMLSVNEELQSSNEELETAKEELQSVNEELHSVNAELSHKVDELDRSNSDLRNVFDSTQIATLFLDGNLVIRSFTPAVSEIFKVIPSDCGRSLSDIVSFLAYQDLSTDVAATLASSRPLERKLVSRDGSAHYLMRILPYRTSEGEVDGVVVTFVNVTPLVQLDEQQALVAELNHRVKNILAVVASMAVQMAQRCGSMAEFTEAFIGRIHGLAKTHDILAMNRWTDIGLRDLIAGEMKAFIADTGRATLDGPEIHLQPRAATTLGIIIHELATNAAKYGAFASPKGRLEVTWRFEAAAGIRQIVLKWQERDGPLTRAPKRNGFGTDLIERSLEFEFGGSATLDYRKEGLVATLAFPADAVTTEEVRHDA